MPAELGLNEDEFDPGGAGLVDEGLELGEPIRGGGVVDPGQNIRPDGDLGVVKGCFAQGLAGGQVPVGNEGGGTIYHRFRSP